MAMSTHFLGIDGGGTHCRARLVDSTGHIIGEATSGCANTTSGLDNSFSSILDATAKILKATNLPKEILKKTHAGLGLAGLVDTVEINKVESYPHPFASLSANSDAATACFGAHNGQDGGIAIFGTGSCCCALHKDELFYNSGWGFMLGDQGSGAQLGLQALRRTILACDNIIPHSSLTHEILQHFDGAPANMVRWTLTAKPKDYGRFAITTCEHADNKEEDANSLLQKSAFDAELFIKDLLAQGVSKIALLGGLSPFLQKHFTEATSNHLVEPQGDAMAGGIYMAKKSFEWGQGQS